MSQTPLVLESWSSFYDIEDNSYLYLSPLSTDTSDSPKSTSKSKPHVRPSALNCDIDACKSTFRRKADLIRHKKSIHGPKSSCTYEGCRYTTGRRDKLREHTASIHGTPNPQETPDPCGKPHTQTKVFGASSMDSTAFDIHDSLNGFDAPPIHDDTSNAPLDMFLSMSQPPSQCSRSTSMNIPSSYSGCTIFDPWSFNNSISSTLSSFDVQDTTNSLEQIFNQPSDFYGLGNWVDDEFSNNLSSSTGTCLDGLIYPSMFD